MSFEAFQFTLLDSSLPFEHTDTITRAALRNACLDLTLSSSVFHSMSSFLFELHDFSAREPLQRQDPALKFFVLRLHSPERPAYPLHVPVRLVRPSSRVVFASVISVTLPEDNKLSNPGPTITPRDRLITGAEHRRLRHCSRFTAGFQHRPRRSNGRGRGRFQQYLYR